MKKIIINRQSENQAIYFDFRQEFPMLGCSYIEEPGFTDVEADTEEIERVEKLIEEEYHYECDADDYQYVKRLVRAWGLWQGPEDDE